MAALNPVIDFFVYFYDKRFFLFMLLSTGCYVASKQIEREDKTLYEVELEKEIGNVQRAKEGQYASDCAGILNNLKKVQNRRN